MYLIFARYIFLKASQFGLPKENTVYIQNHISIKNYKTRQIQYSDLINNDLSNTAFHAS